MTVGQIACEWLEGIRVSVKQSTYPKYYDVVYKRIVPQLGHIKMKKLNNALLNKIYFQSVRKRTFKWEK